MSVYSVHDSRDFFNYMFIRIFICIIWWLWQGKYTFSFFLDLTDYIVFRLLITVIHNKVCNIGEMYLATPSGPD